MNLVEKIARMIDTEGAYSVWKTENGEDSEFTTRQRYWQAKYECLAIDIIKTLMQVSAKDMREDLIAWEKQGWANLGLPIDSIPDFDKLIESKY